MMLKHVKGVCVLGSPVLEIVLEFLFEMNFMYEALRANTHTHTPFNDSKNWRT
jgi:hypothetical protein